MPFTVDLLVTNQICFQVKRAKRLVQRPLPSGPDQNSGKWYRCKDQRPVASVWQFIEVRNKEGEIHQGDEKGKRHLPFFLCA